MPSRMVMHSVTGHKDQMDVGDQERWDLLSHCVILEAIENHNRKKRRKEEKVRERDEGLTLALLYMFLRCKPRDFWQQLLSYLLSTINCPN